MYIYIEREREREREDGGTMRKHCLDTFMRKSSETQSPEM